MAETYLKPKLKVDWKLWVKGHDSASELEANLKNMLSLDEFLAVKGDLKSLDLLSGMQNAYQNRSA
jgi:hypothetical protein